MFIMFSLLFSSICEYFIFNVEGKPKRNIYK